MITAIIAGGSGTRLWPLSTPNYPKHLLSLTNNKSLLRNTVDRVAPISDDVFIIPEASHVDHVYEQLPDVPKENILTEPARRGTAGCIISALVAIQEKHGKDVPVAFLHADHFIGDEDTFRATIKAAAEASVEHGKIALIGVEPSYAATGFGYIKKGGALGDYNGHTVYRGEGFQEKPDVETAELYLKDGNYVWNMGLFAAPISVFEHEIEAWGKPEFRDGYHHLLQAEDKAAAYLDLEEDTIDYALMELLPETLVAASDFEWADIGSFYDLHKVSVRDEDNNHIVGDVHVAETSNSHIRNLNHRPVMVIGMENVVVVNTSEGVLVCRQEDAQHVGSSIKEYWKKAAAKETEKAD